MFFKRLFENLKIKLKEKFRSKQNAKPELLLLCGSGHNGSTILARVLLGHPMIGGEISETFVFGLSDEKSWPAIFEQLALSAGNPTWLLEKTPIHIFNASNIFKIFPTARCICLLRDGREVVASMVKRSHSVVTATERWCNTSREILLLRSKYPNQTILVRYEDLLENPADTLERIASFLAISSSRLKHDPKISNNTTYLGNTIKGKWALKSYRSYEQVGYSLPHDQRRAIQAALPLGGPPFRSNWDELSIDEKSKVKQNDDFWFYNKVFGYLAWGEKGEFYNSSDNISSSI
jgi:hypothetical protein